MNVTRQLLVDEERTLLKKMEDVFPGLLEKFPVTAYVRELQNNDAHLPYDPISGSISEMLDRIKTEHGQASLALYHKISLCRLMQDFLADHNNEKYPTSVQHLFRSWFARIVKDFQTQPDSYYDIDHPLWHLRKDLSVCSGRSIPVGGALVVEKKLVARRAMIRRSKQRWPLGKTDARLDFVASRTSLRRILAQLRKILAARPFVRATRQLMGSYDLCYRVHTVERDIQDFNAQQMDVAYRNMARLLKTDRKVWGIHRASWFLDPAVGEISPKIGFLAQIPLNSGAELYCDGPCSDDDIRKAIMLSPDRSRLYQSGDYVPFRYFYFWPRQRIIESFSMGK